MKAITDLSGLFLCPFQILLDIAGQLSINEINNQAFEPICELNTTNDWINIEALGNPVALRAQILSEILLTELKKKNVHELEIHINLIDAELTVDNLFSLFYLADALNKLEIYFYVESEKIEHLPKNLLSLQAKPNIMTHCFNHQIKEAAISEKSQQLADERYNTLQAMGFNFYHHWFAQNEVSTNLGMLLKYAWACLKSGAYDLSCRVLQQGLSQLSQGAAWEQLFMHLQLIRFLSHQYVVVTNESFPEKFQFIKQNELTNLYFIKAYSATLSRNLTVAETYFKKADINQNTPMTDEASLYQLNLYALFLVLKGDIDSAFALEMQIKNFIEKKQIQTVGLKYVNFINIARIHKRLKQFNQALTFYAQAYNEIGEGGFTTSDHIYYNMNFGSLYEVKAQPKKALFFWVKAALHWLGFYNPYALAWRPRLILCQEKITDILMPLTRDKVNQFFLDKIGSLIAKNNLHLDNKAQYTLHFSREGINQVKKEVGYVAENIILYRCLTPAKEEQQRTSIELALRQLLSTLIRNIMPIPDEKLSVVIDSNHENFYPASAPECLSLSLASGCKVFFYEGRRIDFDAQQIQHGLSQAKITLAKTICSVQPVKDGLQLLYQRSFLNKKIDAQNEINLIEKLGHAVSIDLHQPESAEALKNLMRKKVIALDFSHLKNLADFNQAS